VENGLTKNWENKAHTGSINQVTCHPTDDHQFASVGSDKTLKVWDKRKEKPVHNERTKFELINGVFSPDGRSLVTCNLRENCEDELTFYDPRTWQVVRTIKSKYDADDVMWDKTGSVFFVGDAAGRISLFEGGPTSTKTQASV
jgi:WD40 repeat protein